MDAWTSGHLANWAEGYFRDDERGEAVNEIRIFVREHPAVLDRMSWPEIWALVQRATLLTGAVR